MEEEAGQSWPGLALSLVNSRDMLSSSSLSNDNVMTDKLACRAAEEITIKIHRYLINYIKYHRCNYILLEDIHSDSMERS